MTLESPRITSASSFVVLIWRIHSCHFASSKQHFGYKHSSGEDTCLSARNLHTISDTNHGLLSRQISHMNGSVTEWCQILTTPRTRSPSFKVGPPVTFSPLTWFWADETAQFGWGSVFSFRMSQLGMVPDHGRSTQIKIKCLAFIHDLPYLHHLTIFYFLLSSP